MMRRTLLVAVCLVTTVGCHLFDGGGDPDLGRSGVGDSCSDSRYCRSGLACVAGVCGPRGESTEGSFCTLTGDCVDGLYCGPSRTCTVAGTSPEGGSCASTADCEAGLLCRVEGFAASCRSAGSGDVDDPCTSGFDCLAGLACLGTLGSPTCQSPPAMEGPVPPEVPYWEGVRCEVDDGPPTAYFRVPRGDASDGDFFRLPFPNDVRRTADGLDLSGFPSVGTALDVDVLGRTIEALEEDVDGWSTNPVVYFRFSRGYDGADIGGHVRWVDITEGAPEYGRELGLAWITTSGPITRYICPDWVAFRQGHGTPLRPGHTYAVVLTRGITDAVANLPFERAPDLSALLADAPPAGGDAALAAAYDAYAPLRAWLASQTTTTAGDVLNAAVFTTQSIEGDAAAMRDAIRARELPALSDVTVCAEGVTSPCDDGTPQRACGAPSAAFTEIHARVALPIFQEGTAPYAEPEDGGGLARGADGRPVVVRDEPVCMVMTIPSGAPPPEGFPVVIAAHGTGGSFTGPVGDGLAEAWATGEAAGVPVRAATISWDAPQHGERRGGSSQSPDRLVFSFQSPRAARDVWLQGAADLMALVAFAEGYAADAASSPTGEAIAFDPARIVVFAHSQGATHAALATPFEPSISAVLFSGLGGDLTESLRSKTEPVNIARLVPLALLDFDGAGNLNVGDYHPALSVIQTFYDRVDPVNVGRRMWREPLSDTDAGRHLFMTYGLGDQYSPQPTMSAFAASASLPIVGADLAPIGLPAIDPPASGNVMVGTTARTVGLRQYAPPDGTDGHFVSTTTGRAEVVRFVLEALAGGTPTIGP